MLQNTAWLDQRIYPFPARFLDLDMGRMHYIDVGQGRPLVMVHGTPAWSFLYRHMIQELSAQYRCIAMDHIGFGLSDKPAHWSYRPQDHAQNVQTLIEHLELQDVTLIVHDFGGPIGLAYALAHADNMHALVVFNTWMWSLRGNLSVERLHRLVSGPLGRWLYLQMNISPRLLFKAVWGNQALLTHDIHRHYTAVFPHPAERQSLWVLAKSLIDSSDWYDQLWQQRGRLQSIPTLLAWGMRDPTFSEQDLARWQSALPHAETIRFERAGHFVQEEEYLAATRTVAGFLEPIPVR